MFRVERAWTSAATPLSIVCPTDYAVPPACWHVFVNNCEPSLSQHTAHFIQHESRILRVMQHITQQHCIEALVPDRKMPSVVRQVVDPSGGVTSHIQPDDSCPEHALQVMGDETVATTDIEYIGIRRQYFRDFERHVVSATDLAPASHALKATFDGCNKSCHFLQRVQAGCLKEMLINWANYEVQQICVAKNCRPLLPQICTARIGA